MIHLKSATIFDMPGSVRKPWRNTPAKTLPGPGGRCMVNAI